MAHWRATEKTPCRQRQSARKTAPGGCGKAVKTFLWCPRLCSRECSKSPAPASAFPLSFDALACFERGELSRARITLGHDGVRMPLHEKNGRDFPWPHVRYSFGST